MRLLLVEDDSELVKSLTKPLEAAGYAVDVADNGIDGEYLGNENIYDIAILDLGLPRRNGLEVLANWRKKNNKLPVIILTARDTWQERVDGFKVGADDYIGKPFHIEELLARLTALLHRSKQSPGGTLSTCGLVLDEERQTVETEDGQTHSLTGTEFRLLRYFLLNPGLILSKSKLTDHIYNFDSDKDSNVIEAYIKRLRKILGKDRIETHRGQGYVFKEY
ncbi:MAG: response regulator transcription factor [Gammaproteobacteria bacterium]|nr:response regulator transcription factor [Gammaproteobacteria bacterium]MDH5734855.1 response regulator transcription factor [Gammaproteobacteria bacterium]